MNEELTRAIIALEELQWQTGGRLLERIVSLKHRLEAERDLRTEKLFEVGVMPDATASTPEHLEDHD